MVRPRLDDLPVKILRSVPICGFLWTNSRPFAIYFCAFLCLFAAIKAFHLSLFTDHPSRLLSSQPSLCGLCDLLRNICVPSYLCVRFCSRPFAFFLPSSRPTKRLGEVGCALLQLFPGLATSSGSRRTIFFSPHRGSTRLRTNTPPLPTLPTNHQSPSTNH